MEIVCRFCTGDMVVRNNSGYLRFIVTYKAQKLLIISKNTFINIILNESSYVVDYFVYLCVQIKDICK